MKNIEYLFVLSVVILIALMIAYIISDLANTTIEEEASSNSLNISIHNNQDEIELLDISENESVKLKLDIETIEFHGVITPISEEYYVYGEVCDRYVGIFPGLTGNINIFIADNGSFCVETGFAEKRVCLDDYCIDVSFNEQDCNDALRGGELDMNYTKISCFETIGYTIGEGNERRC